MKKRVCLLLAVLMAVSLLPMGAFAEEAAAEETPVRTVEELPLPPTEVAEEELPTPTEAPETEETPEPTVAPAEEEMPAPAETPAEAVEVAETESETLLATTFAGGTGTKSDPYLIETVYQLWAVKDYTGSVYSGASAPHFKLMADLNWKGYGSWTPIGDKDKAFYGSFDGNGHTISNLSVSGNVQYAGMFGYTVDATIKNLGIVNSSFVSTHESGYAGAIVACATKTITGQNGVISNCYNTGTVRAKCAGGIAGAYMGAYLTDCYNTGTVTATSTATSGSVQAGGISGSSPYKGENITGCHNTGTVSATSEGIPAYAGGIVGYASWESNSGSVMETCYNTGSVTATAGTGTASSGGITGMGGSAASCYNTGKIKASSTGSAAYAGGITGSDPTKISVCYNTGDVTAAGKNQAYAGGIVGTMNRNSSQVENGYNTGGINATSTQSTSYTGGIVGNLLTGTASATLCYNVGGVSGSGKSKTRIGGIVGGWTDWPTVTECYFLNTAASGTGAGNNSSGNVETTPCQEAAMTMQSTFAGFDFSTVWTMSGNGDYRYPELRSVAMEFVKEITSIDFHTKPTKTTYLEGEPLDVTGGQLKVFYNNNTMTYATITPDMVTGFDSTKTGSQRLAVTYGGRTVGYYITVEKNDLLGDVNADGAVNTADLVLLMKHVADPGVVLQNSGDVNFSGSIDILDVIGLARRISEQ